MDAGMLNSPYRSGLVMKSEKCSKSGPMSDSESVHAKTDRTMKVDVCRTDTLMTVHIKRVLLTKPIREMIGQMMLSKINSYGR